MGKLQINRLDQLDQLLSKFVIFNARKMFCKLRFLTVATICLHHMQIVKLVFSDGLIESLTRRRFCQHGRQPEVNRAVIDGE